MHLVRCWQESGFGQLADNNNHLSGFSYDQAGNTANDGVNGYLWNAESDLKTAAGVNYVYDGDGRRVSKSNGKLYWYGAGGAVLAETDGSGNTSNEYVFFGGKRVALLPAGSSAQFYGGWRTLRMVVKRGCRTLCVWFIKGAGDDFPFSIRRPSYQFRN